jgi:predicted aspartyl protease
VGHPSRGLLVDPGATYTVLPRGILEKVGALGLLGKIKIELGDVRTQEADVYATTAEVTDGEGPASVITFEGAEPVVGVQTLQSFDLRVDPEGVLEPTLLRGLVHFYHASVEWLSPRR